MEDDKMLTDYKSLSDRSTIFLVVPLEAPRRIDPSLPHSGEPCMITCENSKESGLIVLKMPCGHPMSPDGLMEYAWAEVSKHGKTKIRCPLCTVIWPLDTIKKYGGASSREMSQLEIGITKNFCTQSEDINQCPSCNSYCEREDPTNGCVKCILCSRKSKSNYHFCWHCLQTWKNNGNSSCGNPNCNDSEKLSLLKKSRKVTIKYVNIETFKLRACPKCGTLIEFEKECKHMQCRRCKVEFCFICLRMKCQGSWLCGSHATKCEVAPIQTRIPKQGK